MTDLGVEATLAQVAERLIPHLETRLARPQHETEA